MIYAELLDKPGGTRLEQGVFMSLGELADFDEAARAKGQCWSGDLKTNIALNRYRNGRCMYCGIRNGGDHADDCTPGFINVG